MSSSRAVHKLSGGLYVSGPPEPPKERLPTMGSSPAPYTGGDVRKSGELGKMFNIPVGDSASRPGSSGGSRPHSGQLPRPTPASPLASAPPSRNTSGPLSQIPATGLITSGTLRRSGGQQQPVAAGERSPAPAGRKAGEAYGPAVTVLPEEAGYGFRVPGVLLYACLVVFMLGLAAGVLVLVVVHKVVILVAVGALVVVVGAVGLWNWLQVGSEVRRFFRVFPDTNVDPMNLPIGKFVKITGQVTCGNIPLETSYQKIGRCVYTSTELYEYRRWNGLPANPNHQRFTWGLKYSKKYVADFYISDRKFGTRFKVSAGNGSRVISFVKPTKISDIFKEDADPSPAFQRWLNDNNLSNGNCIMRLEEGCIQEGSTASVMGILRKQDNTIIIDPPTSTFSTGWQWIRCFFPLYVEGLILLGDESTEEGIYRV